MTAARLSGAALSPRSGLVLAGTASLLFQIVVLTVVARSLGFAVVAGLALIALILVAASQHRVAGAVRRAVPLAGVCGLAMLAGAALDLARFRPLGTHAGWSILLMVMGCWWVCGKHGIGDHGSKAYALGCRACAVVGMLVGMAATSLALGSHGSMAGPGFAVSHLAMVAAMTLGSTAAVAAIRCFGER